MLSKARIEELLKRKGASRRADVPVEVLDALNAGLIPTITLVEWLAMDPVRLLQAVLPKIGLKAEARKIISAYTDVLHEGAERSSRSLGAILWNTLQAHPNRDEIYEKMASHVSDRVRAMATYALAANNEMPLAERLEKSRRFAADPHMGVRECAWIGYRPYVAAELDKGLKLLKPWVKDADPNVRRCAVESTRPRAVWAQHISQLKAEPERALHLLEPVRSDPSRYVQNSVANWLNDASKSRPEWVRDLCERWHDESPTRETAYIVNRATRTLRKQGK